jgi:hypothetical protein
MLIIGCDYHPSMQQIAFADSETGECNEQRLSHSDGEAESFYRELKRKGVSVRVGIEATGQSKSSRKNTLLPSSIRNRVGILFHRLFKAQ